VAWRVAACYGASFLGSLGLLVAILIVALILLPADVPGMAYVASVALIALALLVYA
jgi:hypothetical protein